MSGLLIDNFAGGGGASTGIEQAMGRAVDVAINHDEAAIAVHAANHPRTKHYCQSIFAVDPLDATEGKPVALAWFSPDCKHHSKAKGGKPRDKNIRDMAWVVPHWIERLQKATPNGEGAPQVIMLENVEEFRDWGPLDDHGKPIPERKGEEFKLWLARIRRLGYKAEHRELRACDYGAPTSRKRLFLIARRDGRPIVWPTPTHGHPDSEEVQRGERLPWRTAAECIDWSLPCPSIFDRKRPLKDNTCKRIAAGIVRYVLNSSRPFIVTARNSGKPFTSADEPMHTIVANGAHKSVVAPSLVSVAHGDSGGRREYPATEPLGTVTAKGNPHALSAAAMVKLRNNSHGEDPAAPLGSVTAGGQHHGVTSATLVQTGYGERAGQAPRALDIEKPLGTVVAGGGKHAVATAAFIAQHNTERGDRANPGKPLDVPMTTITGRGTQQQPVQVTMIEADALPREQLARAELVAAFLVKYYGNEDGGHTLGRPLGTVTTRERFAVVTVTLEGEGGDAVTYVLTDIGMRMLTPRELANAQGFPPDYILDPVCTYRTDRGNLKTGRLPKSHQIAKIGNAVCPPMSRALCEANLLSEQVERAAA